MSEQMIIEHLPPDSPTVLAHKFRYEMACGFIRKSDMVIDMACGCGYGTEILTRAAGQVIGIDYDEGSLMHAKIRHSHPYVSFACMDLNTMQIGFDFDVAVSFETTEHLMNPHGHIKNLKKANRTIIMSVPIIPTVGINPHHKQDFTFNGIIDLIQDDTWHLYQGVKQDFSHEYGTYGIFVFQKR